MKCWRDANELLVGVLGVELSPSLVVKPQPDMSKKKKKLISGLLESFEKGIGLVYHLFRI